MMAVANNILVLIPAFNEAGRIAPVILGAKSYLPILVIDDGSADDTAGVAEVNGAQVLGKLPNQGKGASLRAGFWWALERGFEAVITLDADGQHDPAEIPVFLDAYEQRHPDLLIGQRNFAHAFFAPVGEPVRILAFLLGNGAENPG